ncbi:hypothetical protein ACQ4PT_038437 [Festuca glaucescens]
MPKSGHPKFKRLRKRLHYKTRVEDAHIVEDENEKIFEEQFAADNSKKERRKQNFFNRASPMKIVTLYKHQNDSHRHIISHNGFDSFLNIKCSKLHPSLCYFLMESFNVETCELEFPGRGSIPITNKLVHKVLGLPMGQYPVVHQTDEEAIAFVMVTLGFGNGKQPKLSDVKAKLKSKELGDPVYFMMWVIYVVCSMLAPTTGVYISPKYYPTKMDPTKIKLLNWCRFVIVIIIAAAKEKGRKSPFKACMTFLMIAYIDALETTDITVDKQGPRICAWDNKSVASAILQDTKPDGSYGMLPLKKTFRINKVLMLSTLARIESFVRANVPPNCGEEEMVRYRIATQQMYGEIDDAISKFLKNVGTNTHSTVPVTVKKRTSKTHLQQVPNNGASSSQLIKRRHQEQFVRHSSSSEESDNSDGDYFEDYQPGNQSEQEGMSLDEESFDFIASEDDDFMTAPNKREECHPIRQSRWCRQSTTAAVKSTINDRKNYRRKEQQQGVKLHTEAKLIQIREPRNCCLQKPHNLPRHEGVNEHSVDCSHQKATKRKFLSMVLKGKADICAPNPGGAARKKARSVQMTTNTEATTNMKISMCHQLSLLPLATKEVKMKDNKQKAKFQSS